MKITLFSVFKHLGVISILCLIEPIVMLAQILWGSETYQIGMARVLVLGAGCLGYGVQLANLSLYKKCSKTKKMFFTIGDLGLSLYLVIGFVNHFYGGSTYLWLSMTGITLGAMILGIFMAYKPYDQIYCKGVISVLGVIGIICSLKVESLFYLLIVLLNIMIYTLIRNQQNIDQLLERTQKNVSTASTIRQYNMKLISLLMSIVLVTCLLKDYIVRLLLLMGNLLKEVIRQLIMWLNALAGKEEIVEEIVEQSTNDQMMLPLEYQEPNKWLEILAWVIGIALLVVALRYALKILAKWLKKGIMIVMKWLNKFLSYQEKDLITMDYYDQVEALDEIKKKHGFGSKKRAFKAWKKSIKVFEEEEDLGIKYRLGYRLVLEWLRLKELKVNYSDTTLEICEKARQKEASWQFDEETQAYNELQYGDYKVTAEEIELLEKTLSRMKEELKK